MGVLVRVSIPVKGHHDHGKPYKWKYLIRAGLQFRGVGPFSLWWEAGACRQTWCWGCNWEFYLWTHNQQEMTVDAPVRLELLRPHNPSASGTVTWTRPHWLIVTLPLGLWGQFFLKLPHWVFSYLSIFILHFKVYLSCLSTFRFYKNYCSSIQPLPHITILSSCCKDTNERVGEIHTVNPIIRL